MSARRNELRNLPLTQAQMICYNAKTNEKSEKNDNKRQPVHCPADTVLFIVFFFGKNF